MNELLENLAGYSIILRFTALIVAVGGMCGLVLEAGMGLTPGVCLMAGASGAIVGALLESFRWVRKLASDDPYAQPTSLIGDPDGTITLNGVGLEVEPREVTHIHVLKGSSVWFDYQRHGETFRAGLDIPNARSRTLNALLDRNEDNS